MFKGFKAVGVYGAGVACKDNDKGVIVVLVVLLVELFVVIGWLWLWCYG